MDSWWDPTTQREIWLVWVLIIDETYTISVLQNARKALPWLDPSRLSTCSCLQKKSIPILLYPPHICNPCILHLLPTLWHCDPHSSFFFLIFCCSFCIIKKKFIGLLAPQLATKSNLTTFSSAPETGYTPLASRSMLPFDSVSEIGAPDKGLPYVVRLVHCTFTF